MKPQLVQNRGITETPKHGLI